MTLRRDLMRQSQLFTRTQKEAPKDEVAKNAQLLIRAGFVEKELAGVYDYLPLGLRTLNKIIGIIRKNMDEIGGQEMSLSALQDPEPWKKTDRWDDKVVDVWFKTALKNGGEVGLGSTHEEPITELMKRHISSYRDLPVYAYQFQTKFRNETRAKSGIMRSREFVMKDLYSFSRNQEELDSFYEEAKEAYRKIFEEAGIGNETCLTFASGGSFSKYSHEFQTVCEAGEDIIYVDEKKGIAVNREVYNDEVLNDLGLSRDDMVERKSIEVGNIFKLGNKFSGALGLEYTAEDGSKLPVVMGCYGIGPGRLMGTIVELMSDEKGLVWPETVAPFQVHLIELKNDDERVRAKSEEIYEALEKAGIEVLFDDREASAGAKFADADLIGIPYQLIVGEKNLKEDKVEIKSRRTGETEFISSDHKNVVERFTFSK